MPGSGIASGSSVATEAVARDESVRIRRPPGVNEFGRDAALEGRWSIPERYPTERSVGRHRVHAPRHIGSFPAWADVDDDVDDEDPVGIGAPTWPLSASRCRVARYPSLQRVTENSGETPSPAECSNRPGAGPRTDRRKRTLRMAGCRAIHRRGDGVERSGKGAFEEWRKHAHNCKEAARGAICVLSKGDICITRLFAAGSGFRLFTTLPNPPAKHNDA